MEHSKTFGLSGAPRWAFCPGAPKMCADEPDTSSEEADEGDAAHWVAQQMLETYKLGGDGVAIGHITIGRQSPNGLIVTDEMFDGALTYYNVITKTIGDGDRQYLYVEQRVKAHHTLDPEAWGTLDCMWYDITTNTLYIWDFKFGHFSVVAFDNMQLVAYAVAAGETFNYDKIKPRLNLNIVQPRCYDGLGPVRNWITTYDDLRAHVNIMKMSITDHRMNKGLVKSGAWCRECPARYKCPAIRQAAAVAIDWSMTAIPLNMSNDALAYELEITDRAEARIKQRKLGIYAEAESRVRAGQLIPGRRMQETSGTRKWSRPVAEIIMLGETLGQNFKKDQEVISPHQVEQLLKRNNIDASVISNYHHTPKTGVKLIADDGSRAAQLFSQEKI
jgi:hypothetical protein